MILERINSPSDVKALHTDECRTLCKELRQFLVEKVSRTGGHLASSLGAVELTVAIHRVFDTSVDRLVFDVGHQCYAHKALTGRRELFDTLRQYEGMSGFPKPYESEHDAFIAGHASNSVSVALGMARARTLQKKDHHVIALIGDGALGGGLSFEGLNDAGASGEPLIVILNDNGMSISPNVGGIANLLSNLRSRPGYYEFKKRYRDTLSENAVGKKVYELTHDVKTALKKSFVPNATPFENMGFAYLGPVDGHDVEKLCYMLTLAKEMNCPVLLHVKTQKGKGYGPAESEPGRFHGIGPFDPATGKSLKGPCDDFSAIFGRELTDIADSDERVCAITAAMAEGTGLTGFARRFPRRFFNVGIAEGHAVALAAGMAKQGLVPVVAIYSTFLQRGYDQLLHDVALQNLHVVFAVDRAGLVGADGETHHGVFDTGYLTQIPGMTVLCPSNFAELRTMLRRAVLEIDGPVAVRYPRGGEGSFAENCADCDLAVLRTGRHGTIVSYGTLINEAIGAADLLQRKNIFVSVIKLNGIAPLDSEKICAELWDGKPLLVAEECMAESGIGRLLPAVLAENRKSSGLLILRDLGSKVPGHGSVEQLRRVCGIDAQGIAKAFEEAYHEQ